jgi:ABC-2 type transport system ATP-binding protein
VSVIAIEDLHYSVRQHFWSRTKEVLRGITLQVEAGELFGFLGPNGAGKTTTLKALLGLLTPTRGRALLFGESAHQAAVRRRLGFMPERAYFPEHLSARELVVQHGILAGLDWRQARRQASVVMERVGIAYAAEERLRNFSKGMLQRVGLAQAIVGDPELVVLDEPMSGLDPLGRRDVRELMVSLRDAGKTVFFSTHILPDVETICDRVAMVVAGQVRQVARLSELLVDTASGVDIEAEGCTAAALEAVSALGAAVPHGKTHVLHVADPAGANQAIDRLRQHHAVIISVQTQRRSLEQVFVEAATDPPRGDNP